MPVSYKKLWKISIVCGMKTKDLCAAGIGHASIAWGCLKNEVAADVPVKICTA
nr:XRE family transcriptional regulator [Anaerotruncus colihominis]